MFRGALRYGFSQDDFVGLARAMGLAPRLVGPWRIVSQQLWFDAGHALAGLDALRWHAASLATHALATALVFAFLRRAASRAGAAVGAAFFGAHAAAFAALFWVAAWGDLGALTLALAALLVARRADAVRWAALPLFALSLLCKESTLLLPIVAWADAAWRGRSRDALPAALAVVAIAFAAWLAVAGSGTAPSASSTAPYAAGLGAHLGANLLTYAGWIGGAFAPLVRSFGDAVDPGAYLAGAAFLAVALAGNFVPACRAGGWSVAGAWIVCFLAPVLLLRNHVYHYYAYAALPGAAWLASIAFDLATARPAGRRGAVARRAWAVVAVALFLANGAALVSRIEHTPLFGEESRADPTVDRALVAARAVGSVRSAQLPVGTRLAFWSPAARLAHGDPGPVERYGARNVRDALAAGVGVRVLCPEVGACAFVDAPPEHGTFDFVALFHSNGEATIVPASQLDTLLAQLPR